MTESDGETATLFPKAARLRNLTYSAPLYVDVTKRVIKKGHDGEEVTETQDFGKVFIGKVCFEVRQSLGLTGGNHIWLLGKGGDFRKILISGNSFCALLSLLFM